jgi:hypothetical protein
MTAAIKASIKYRSPAEAERRRKKIGGPAIIADVNKEDACGRHLGGQGKGCKGRISFPCPNAAIRGLCIRRLPYAAGEAFPRVKSPPFGLRPRHVLSLESKGAYQCARAVKVWF